ncbi:uncharacterized protein LOC131153338 isoform X6 [Malania oleifera]|uniref:uncharacterized protein LOC131153338 isoform X6 n=1 Tax=Malania oleifera TaxID=397392 RepID=UPI0025AECA09|nr:uncharacterized protein LOC131153338 isoform X6 [Malania oleifera]
MGGVIRHVGFPPRPWQRLPGAGGGIVSSYNSANGVSRRQALEQVDKELAKGDERAALSLVKDLQGKPGGLRCFGAASHNQVPQRLFTLDELKLNGIETSSLLAPVDATLGSIERNLQLAAIVGGISAWNVFGFNAQQILYLSLGLLFLWTLDSVSFNGGVGSLVLDTIGHTFSRKYHNRVIQVNAGKVSAVMLNRFSCIALAGVATEYLLYGYSEGGLADIDKLDSLLKSLGFTQKKANSQVRWAVLNTFLILRRHEKARAKLAAAMMLAMSVGTCIDIVEETMDDTDI